MRVSVSQSANIVKNHQRRKSVLRKVTCNMTRENTRAKRKSVSICAQADKAAVHPCA